MRKYDSTIQNPLLCEQLLNSWLDMSNAVRNERLVQTMTFREVLVCNIIYRMEVEQKKKITATDIVELTGILKSQVNRVILGLVERGILSRERSQGDRRLIFIHLTKEGIHAYQTEHEHVLQILSIVIRHLGEDNAKSLMENMKSVALAMKSVHD